MFGNRQAGLIKSAFYSSGLYFIIIYAYYSNQSYSRCGYDHLSRQKLVERKDGRQHEEDWERSTPYPFTGCLAHVEIIEHDDGCITWIAGVLDHNEGCKKAVLERRPHIPLHEHVYEIALEQLRNGSR